MNCWFLLGVLFFCVAAGFSPAPRFSPRKTTVSITGDQFYINGQPTYNGRIWHGHNVQGLLLNSRMVQGIFDDRNPATSNRWAYPDTGRWDADRNTREFLAAMGEWRRHGLLAFTINLQGGSPEGYSKEQPWHNSAIEADGSLRDDYMKRLEKILNKADELGMVVILGYFYFGQDERLRDEAAVLRAVDTATQWLFDRGYQNVLVEINNECNVRYDHDILKPERVHELIDRVRSITRNGHRFLAGTSYGGGTLPRENVVRAADFLLIHGNGVSDPARIGEMVRKTRAVPGNSPKPILFNEDDHFNFDQPKNNFLAALGEHASWGYFDPGTNNYSDGFQSPPVDWGLNTERKRAFFQLVAEITSPSPLIPPPPATLARQRGESDGREEAARGRGTKDITQVSYHGWSNCFRISNAKAEVTIVPAIGRVMQFGFAGEEGVLWENRSLDGQALDGSATNWSKSDWINFGGDKTWPSPEAEWSKYTKRESWRPPPAFDAMPVEARVEGGDVILTSPVDPFLGVRTQRRVHLDPDVPVLSITTRYERVSGNPAKIGIWVITQLKDPAGIYVLLPTKPKFPNGYALLGKEKPPSLKLNEWASGAIAYSPGTKIDPADGIVTMSKVASLSRNPKDLHKIGTDASTLLWVGEKSALRIDSARTLGADYPDQGSSAEVYTNPDPLKYVELEMLGPLHTLKVGDKIEQVNTYTLIRRTEATADAEARRILGR